jgi:hypothetical protein
MDKVILIKANAIAKTFIPYPSIYSHEDEHTYLHNQLVWAVRYCYKILSELNMDKTKATEKWISELEKPDMDVTSRKIVKACLDENFKTKPQKCSLAKEEIETFQHLAHLDDMDQYR